MTMSFVRKDRPTIVGMLCSCTPAVKAQILASLVQKVWPKVSAREVEPTVYKVLPIQKAEAACDILYKGQNVSKVVPEVQS